MKLVLPQRISNHRHQPRFTAGEGSAFHHRYSERLKIIRGDGCAMQLAAGVLEHQRERLKMECQHGLHGFQLRGVIQIIRKTLFRLVHFAVRGHAKRHQPVRLNAGRGLGENPVDHGVDGGVPSDAQSHQRDRGRA